MVLFYLCSLRQQYKNSPGRRKYLPLAEPYLKVNYQDYFFIIGIE